MSARARAPQHNKDGDCWVVIDKKVYDVSKFLDDHPVGALRRAIYGWDPDSFNKHMVPPSAVV